MIYSGSKVKNIATSIARNANDLDQRLKKGGFEQLNDQYFDGLLIKCEVSKQDSIRQNAEKAEMNFRYFENGNIGICIDETTTQEDLSDICAVFGVSENISNNDIGIHSDLIRKSDY